MVDSRYAYIEFAAKDSALKAKHFHESLFMGRQLTVMPKRKNLPGRGRGAAVRRQQGALNALISMLGGGRRGFRGARRPFRGH